ncbi:6-bladed beta-propeller protein [Chryseobacterium sp. 52]|uniref:6-bladed beta-propeller n=1 Tax=Chryseobacterium sp. 52 TaxID=2035213 RepID=UPI000C198729|nr:6-bladed beta-propeller [Chryseobacterium sp. 52]PIF45308.1 6-bladed beta-propeller protein [Chryseobacterium sp. 52]
MLIKRIAISHIIFISLTITSCNYLSESSKYSGFEKAIDVKKITELNVENKDSVTKITIPPSEELKFNYNKYIKQVKFVKLETNESSQIGLIDRLIFGNNRIIVVDERITKSVFIFDTAGKFINKIATKPVNKESGLSRFQKVSYDYLNDQIILFDDKAILCYYFDTSGKFLKKEKQYISFSNFLNIPGTNSYAYLTMYGVNNHIPKISGNDLAIGKAGTIISKTVLNDPSESGKINSNIFNLNNLCFSGKNVFFTPMFSNLSYIVTKDENVYAKYRINFSGESMSSIVRKHPDMNINKYMELLRSHKYYNFSGTLFESGNSLYIEVQKENRIGLFYDKKSGSVTGGNLIKTESRDTRNLISFFKYPFASTGSDFVSFLTPNDLKQFKTLNKDFPRELKDVTPSSNPVLMFFRLKDF